MNEKTQIIPLENGIEFLGARYYISKSGKVILKMKQQSKKRFKKHIKRLLFLKKHNRVDSEYIKCTFGGLKGHIKQLNAYKLSSLLSFFIELFIDFLNA